MVPTITVFQDFGIQLFFKNEAFSPFYVNFEANFGLNLDLVVLST